jgi:hypothetical protein
MDRFCDKMNSCAECYASAFTALSHLDPVGDLTLCLHKLDHSKDLQLPCREEDPKDLKKKKRECQAGENRCQLSGIWLVLRVGGPPKDVVMADEINDSEFTLYFHPSSTHCILVHGLKPGVATCTVVSHLLWCTLADNIYSCSSPRHAR